MDEVTDAPIILNEIETDDHIADRGEGDVMFAIIHERLNICKIKTLITVVIYKSNQGERFFAKGSDRQNVLLKMKYDDV